MGRSSVSRLAEAIHEGPKDGETRGSPQREVVPAVRPIRFDDVGARRPETRPACLPSANGKAKEPADRPIAPFGAGDRWAGCIRPKSFELRLRS